MDSAPVIIIGAGIGGLAAAIRLAAAGERVLVVEQNETVGGKMGEFRQAGFRWDTGPSVITMRPVFEELFQCAGRQLADYLTLQPLDPLTRYFWPDGTVLDATSDLTRMAAQLAHLHPQEMEGYLRFLAYAAQLYRLTSPVFIYDHPPTWRSLLRAGPLDLLRIQPWLTMDQLIRRHVYSPHLRQLLGRFATYVGASPYLAPATLSVIAHVELTGGVWYPQGGVYAIAQAYARLAAELGVVIRTGCPVTQIRVQAGRAVGVTCATGEQLTGKAVIANVDVTTVYAQLLPATPAIARRRAALVRREPSCSGYALLLGVAGEHPQLAHHNIFFAADYRREFTEIFQRGVPPTEPTIYVAISAKSDPTHAPAGCENWFVLVNAPALGGHFDWATQEANYRQIVFSTLAQLGFDLTGRIRTSQLVTPLDLARITGAWRGALYGLSSNQARNAFRRPHNRCREVAGLYFAGGTTHPGGGVPMVTLSGKVAAELVLADLRG